MNAQNLDNKPKVKKESKNKIRVEFDRTPLKERLKAKFFSMYFLTKLIVYIFRLVLLVGVSYVVLFPFFSWISGSFMAPDDFIDATVRLVPKNFTLDIYKAIWTEFDYLEAFKNTFILSAGTALIQTFICSFIAYGLAKFKFKGNGILFLLVIFSLVVPHQTLLQSMNMEFRYFDILGIVQFLTGGGIDIFGLHIPVLEGVRILPEAWKTFSTSGVDITNTYWPLVILSASGLAFKNGLYIFMLRQFFKGVPDELEESAYIDGSGVIHTFFKIILPISVPMMITVFIFSFSWQWTDDFYISNFMRNLSDKTPFMYNIMNHNPAIPKSLEIIYPGQDLYYAAIKNTCGIMVIAPLVIMYLFCQRYLVQGIERSGLTAD